MTGNSGDKVLESLIGLRQEVSAPAKVNLRLKITGRRGDGYHLLSMLNAALNFHDRLVVAVEEGRQVRLDIGGEKRFMIDSGLTDPSRNLAARAAERFLQCFKVPAGISIRLEKRIPPGGGLGGGSSDAAAVLLVLRRMFGVWLKEEKRLSDFALEVALSSLALELGADVPYFLWGGLAHVSGIGEEIGELDAAFLEGVECLLVMPPFSIPTVQIFKLYDRLGICGEKEGSAPHPASYEELSQMVENDLEPAVLEYSAPMARLLPALRDSADALVSISGSGSSIFCLPKYQKRFDKSDLGRLQEAASKAEAKLLLTNFLIS